MGRFGQKTAPSRKKGARKKNGRHLGAVGGNGNGRGPVLDGLTGAVVDEETEGDEKPAFDEEAFKGRLLRVSSDELIHTLAVLRGELAEAKSAHGRTGRAVQGVQQKIELVLVEIEGRDERRNQPSLL